MKAQNMTSSNGNSIPSQFIIRDKNGRYFQSYQSIIAFIDYEGNVSLDAKTWDYSRTTGKYRNIFLGETKKETEAKIKSGKYKIANLN